MKSFKRKLRSVGLKKIVTRTHLSCSFIKDCFCKFAVRAIMEGLRKEELKNNIRTTIISPGAVNTELTETITDKYLKEAFDKLSRSS